MTEISVIGSGAWGTALAQLIAKNGKDVTLWARRPELAAAINEKHENTDNLPEIRLHPALHATNDLAEAAKADTVFLVTPAQSMRRILNDIATLSPKVPPSLILCSKGIELKSGQLMSDVAAEIMPKSPICILSGPNFAREIAQGQPAATTLASASRALAEEIQNLLGSPRFRPYIADDITGVQLSGALKNVIAIAAGIAQGLGFGESTRASLVTRGMAEIVRLGCAMGAQAETFLGLSGMGDLMLTCTSLQSRNYALGLALGQGEKHDDLRTKSRAVTEGVHTATAALELARRHNIEMPVANAVHQCLEEGRRLDDAIKEMLNRPLREEKVNQTR